MVKHLLVAAILMLSAICSVAQDIIYLNNGNKFSGIVTEINPTSIKYKAVQDRNGPTYLISREDVLLIEYKSGEVEIINKNPVAPKEKPVNTSLSSDHVQGKKYHEQELRYLHKTTLMINGLALANADITLLLDHEFANSHLSVTFLGGYNFNKAVTWPNAIIGNYLVGAKKNFDLGTGLNWYPSNRKKVQYFMGLWFKYMSYDYLKEIRIQEQINGVTYTHSQFQPKTGFQFATLWVNGFQIRLSPFVNYKMFFGLGGYNPQPDLKEAIQNKYPQYKAGTELKVYAGMCFGYRF